MLRAVFWMAVGAAGMYFLDPDRGTRRRNLARDRLMATARDVQHEAEQRARYAASTAEGMTQKVQHDLSTAAEKTGAALDDFTLSQKVQTELFRDPNIDKGNINVSVENGVVVLRGIASRPDEIDSILSRVRSIEGVQRVDNRLHLPDTPPPGESTYSYSS